jgi:hypothetical protein
MTANLTDCNFILQFVKRVTLDIAELQGALVKSTENFQQIQALLEKPSPTPGKLLGLRCL